MSHFRDPVALEKLIASRHRRQAENRRQRVKILLRRSTPPPDRLFDAELPPELRNPYLRVGSSEWIGVRASMEDATAIDVDRGFFAVFDGHQTANAAIYARENLFETFFRKFEDRNVSALNELMSRRLPIGAVSTPEQSSHLLTDRSIESINLSLVPDPALIPIFLREAFVATHAELKTVVGGTCAAVCHMPDRRNLFTANVGDSRILLIREGNESEVLTVDHNPTTPSERDRLQVLFGIQGTGRIGGILNVSRALGDHFSHAVSPDPFTMHVSLRETDQCLVIGCDGLWDVVSNDEVVGVVTSFDDPRIAAQELVKLAAKNRTTDNVSVIVVKFDF